jgi:hypothetical protein
MMQAASWARLDRRGVEERKNSRGERGGRGEEKEA